MVTKKRRSVPLPKEKNNNDVVKTEHIISKPKPGKRVKTEVELPKVPDAFPEVDKALAYIMLNNALERRKKRDIKRYLKQFNNLQGALV